MADDDLDLTTGDPSATAEGGSRRRRRRSSSAGSDKSGDDGDRKRNPTEVRSRLDRVFDRIEKMLRERDDEELATVIHEDGDAMANGIVSLVGSVPFLFLPIIMILNLVEPVLAFGRVGRILGRRIRDRLTVRAQTRADAQAEWEAAAAAQAEAEAAGAVVQ